MPTQYRFIYIYRAFNHEALLMKVYQEKRVERIHFILNCFRFFIQTRTCKQWNVLSYTVVCYAVLV